MCLNLISKQMLLLLLLLLLQVPMHVSQQVSQCSLNLVQVLGLRMRLEAWNSRNILQACQTHFSCS